MIIAEYIFYLFFALFPFLTTNYFLYGPSSFRSVFLIATASILGILLAIQLFKSKSSSKISRLNLDGFFCLPIVIALLVYFVFLAISGIFGLSFNDSFWSKATRTTGIWYLINLGIFMLALWPIVADEIKRHRLILVTIISTAIYSVLSLLGPEGWGWIFKSYPNDAFTFGNSTFAGMYLFGAFLLAVYYLWQADKKKWWMYVLPVIIIFNPYLLSWRGIGEAQASAYVVLFSIVALLVVWGISKIKNQKTRSIVAYSVFGLGLVIIVLTSFSLFSTDGYLKEAYLGRSSAVRPIAWEMSWGAIKERPLLGWGSDNFERVFEANYDNRIPEVGEFWLDRAHNITIDQLVDVGIVGFGFYVLVYLVIILSLVYVALNSPEKQDRILAAILLAYFPLHFVELQTAFDTSISYPMLALMIVLAAALFQRTRKSKEFKSYPIFNKSLGVLLLGFVLWSVIWGLIPFVRAQIANGRIRTVGSSEKRIPLYPALLSSPVDQHAFLWRTFTDFQRGIMENPKVLENREQVEGFKKEIEIIETRYREYVKNNPAHFRAKLNLADVLIYQNLFDSNKLAEAQEVLDEAIKLVPESPQSYWMKAVAYVYMNKFDLARESARKGMALNPRIQQSQEIVDYVERSAKTFPEIDLFFFRQI